MFAKVHQKSLQKCAKMFEKVRQKTVWQKCAQNVCKSVPKMLSKSVPKIFAKVCQKCLQKWAKNCCKSAPKKLFCKSAPKQCFAKVCQSVAKCTKTFSKLAFFRILSLGPEPGERGFTYLQVVPAFGGAKQVMTSDIIKCTSFYTFPWPPNKKVNPKYLPLFPTVHCCR